MSKKKNTSKDEEVIKAYKNDFTNVKSDVNGSYTGITENYEVIVDRKDAIKEAIAMLNKKDILVIAGKGHEIYQEVKGEKLPFDEREIVKHAADKMPGKEDIKY